MIETNLLNRYLHYARSQDADERAEAARELKSFLRNEQACATLFELLGDDDWRVRRAAVESFIEMRPIQAIPQILQALYDEENAGRRNAAIDILMRMGKEIVPYLQPHLSSPNTDVKMFLINILGDLRDDTFLDFITAALRNSDANMVSAAILAIGKIGHSESLPHLIEFLRGDNPWMTFQAIEAAGEMQDAELIPDLVRLHESPFYQKAAVKALSKFHDEAAYEALSRFLVVNGELDTHVLAALIDLYHSPGPQELKREEQQKIREQLRRTLKKDEIGTLMLRFGNSDLETRKQIMQVLGWSRAKEAVPLLIHALQDPELMELAAQALIDCDRESVKPLTERLRENLSEDEIALLLMIFNELTGTMDPGLAQQFMQHESAEIRYQAFRLISRLQSPDITSLLIRGVLDSHLPIHQLCRDPLLDRCRKNKTIRAEVSELMRQKVHSADPEERANALEFLILLEGETAFTLLFQALKDEEAIVRQKAISLMSTGYHHEFQRPLIAALADEDARARELAARALASYSAPEVVDALISSMRDEALWVRVATYESLSAIGDDKSEPAFIQQMESENPMGCSILLKGLGQFRSSRTKEFLLKYLNMDDPEIRKSACESLGIFNDNDIVFRLFTLMQNDADWGVRVAAIRALTNIRPFRLQEALLERLRIEEDPFVRKEILASLLTIGVDHVPHEVYEFLLHHNLADSAYEFLMTCRQKFGKQIQEASRRQAPAIRRILKTIVG